MGVSSTRNRKQKLLTGIRTFEIDYHFNFGRCAYQVHQRYLAKIIHQIIVILGDVIEKDCELMSIPNHLFGWVIRPGTQWAAAHANRSKKQPWEYIISANGNTIVVIIIIYIFVFFLNIESVCKIASGDACTESRCILEALEL